MKRYNKVKSARKKEKRSRDCESIEKERKKQSGESNIRRVKRLGAKCKKNDSRDRNSNIIFDYAVYTTNDRSMKNSGVSAIPCAVSNDLTKRNTTSHPGYKNLDDIVENSVPATGNLNMRHLKVLSPTSDVSAERDTISNRGDANSIDVFDNLVPASGDRNMRHSEVSSSPSYISRAPVKRSKRKLSFLLNLRHPSTPVIRKSSKNVTSGEDSLESNTSLVPMKSYLSDSSISSYPGIHGNSIASLVARTIEPPEVIVISDDERVASPNHKQKLCKKDIASVSDASVSGNTLKGQDSLDVRSVSTLAKSYLSGSRSAKKRSTVKKSIATVSDAYHFENTMDVENSHPVSAPLKAYAPRSHSSKTQRALRLITATVTNAMETQDSIYGLDDVISRMKPSRKSYSKAQPTNQNIITAVTDATETENATEAPHVPVLLENEIGCVNSSRKFINAETVENESVSGNANEAQDLPATSTTPTLAKSLPVSHSSRKKPALKKNVAKGLDAIRKTDSSIVSEGKIGLAKSSRKTYSSKTRASNQKVIIAAADSETNSTQNMQNSHSTSIEDAVPLKLKRKLFSCKTQSALENDSQEVLDISDSGNNMKDLDSHNIVSDGKVCTFKRSRELDSASKKLSPVIMKNVTTCLNVGSPDEVPLTQATPEVSNENIRLEKTSRKPNLTELPSTLKANRKKVLKAEKSKNVAKMLDTPNLLALKKPLITYARNQQSNTSGLCKTKNAKKLAMSKTHAKMDGNSQEYDESILKNDNNAEACTIAIDNLFGQLSLENEYDSDLDMSYVAQVQRFVISARAPNVFVNNCAFQPVKSLRSFSENKNQPTSFDYDTLNDVSYGKSGVSAGKSDEFTIESEEISLMRKKPIESQISLIAANTGDTDEAMDWEECNAEWIESNSEILSNPNMVSESVFSEGVPTNQEDNSASKWEESNSEILANMDKVSESLVDLRENGQCEWMQSNGETLANIDEVSVSPVELRENMQCEWMQSNGEVLASMDEVSESIDNLRGNAAQEKNSGESTDSSGEMLANADELSESPVDLEANEHREENPGESSNEMLANGDADVCQEKDKEMSMSDVYSSDSTDLSRTKNSKSVRKPSGASVEKQHFSNLIEGSKSLEKRSFFKPTSPANQIKSRPKLSKKKQFKKYLTQDGQKLSASKNIDKYYRSRRTLDLLDTRDINTRFTLPEKQSRQRSSRRVQKINKIRERNKNSAESSDSSSPNANSYPGYKKSQAKSKWSVQKRRGKENRGSSSSPLPTDSSSSPLSDISNKIIRKIERMGRGASKYMSRKYRKMRQSEDKRNNIFSSSQASAGNTTSLGRENIENEAKGKSTTFLKPEDVAHLKKDDLEMIIKFADRKTLSDLIVAESLSQSSEASSVKNSQGKNLEVYGRNSSQLTLGTQLEENSLGASKESSNDSVITEKMRTMFGGSVEVQSQNLSQPLSSGQLIRVLDSSYTSPSQGVETQPSATDENIWSSMKTDAHVTEMETDRNLRKLVLTPRRNDQDAFSTPRGLLSRNLRLSRSSDTSLNSDALEEELKRQFGEYDKYSLSGLDIVSGFSSDDDFGRMEEL